MTNLDRARTLPGAKTVLAVLLGFLLCVSTAAANILPEAALLVHVRPALPEGQECATNITDCSQIVHTTSADGQLEFQIYFYPRAYLENHYPIHHLTANLAWPDTWHLVRWATCGGGNGSLQPDGAEQTLTLTWPNCPPITGTLFLVASLVLDVTGPGRLNFAPAYAAVPVWLGCPPNGFNAMALGIYAVAGLECGYSHNTCATADYCMPVFNPEVLALTAPVGGMDAGQAPFAASSAAGPPVPCPLTVTPHAPWVQASVVAENWPNFHLEVIANATGLEEGLHEAWIEVSAYQAVARCLKVDFTVTPNTAAPDDGGTVRSQTWGRIKDGYRRP